MLLNKITVNNLGVFSGKHEINLTPKTFKEKIKPVIIFGGMNGSGKTTIFDAIKLCLYGSEIFPGKNQAQYQKYLKDKINSSNGTLLKANNAYIEIEFDYSTFGEKNTYQVQRYWEIKGKKVSEALFIKKNGESIDEVDKEYWQSFIKEMIPVGLSQLFFFDGEKIQKMMHDENNTELRKSIMTLLGLDLIERLQADLKIYKRGLLKEQGDASVKKEIEQSEKEFEAVDKEFNSAKSKLISIDQKISVLETKISDHENRIEAQGGGYFKRKEALLEKKNSLEKEMEILKEKIRDISAGLLPITIAKKLAKKLKAQIIDEESVALNNILNDTLTDKLGELKKIAGTKKFLNSLKGIDIDNKTEFKKSLLSSISNIILPENDQSDIEVIHELSQRQSAEAINNINYALTKLPNMLKKLTKDYEKKYREFQKVYSTLNQVPEEGMLKPLYKKLNGLNVQYGELLNEQKNLAEAIHSINFRKTEIERKLNNIDIKDKENTKSHSIEQLVKKAEEVIAKYYDQLSKKKIAQLEKEFTEIFLMLHRKEDLISKVKINPETCDVYVYDKYNSKLNKNNLSSGELEIYAISMVWALANMSGQKLPFVIDTPLARLDSKHRDNLINKFFPHAAHQMLIFSTNTEIDEKYFNQLKPYVSRSYKFDYHDYEKRSEIKEGYFWN